MDKEIAFASADLTVEYDNSKLEYVKYTELDLFKQSAMNIVKNNSETGKIAIGYVSDPYSANAIKKAGQMLSITFKIKPNVTEDFKINLKCTSMKTDSGENIQVSEAQSEISIITKSNNIKPNESSENNKNIENEASKINSSDSKKSNNAFPKTGKGLNWIIILIILSSIIGYFSYKKYKYLRKI